MVVASFLAEVPDASLEPALNGAFYTAAAAGWFLLSWVVQPIGPLAIGVDFCQVIAYIGPPSPDSLEVRPQLTLGSGGEGTQALTETSRRDIYLKAGQSLHLQGSGLNLIIGVRLEQISGGL